MLKKIKQKDIVILITIFMAVTVFCINARIEISDELWNFSNIYKMTNGFVIYKDLNVIITPIFFYIGQLIFKIFGANYLIFRIYNILIYSTFFYLIYIVFKKLEIKTRNSLIYTSIFFIMCMPIIKTGANYNTLALNTVLLGIIIYLKNKNSVIQGIIIFLILMIKQNIGTYYAIALVLSELVINKKNIKLLIKKISISATTSICLMGLYILYLILTNNLYSAINYTILGLGEFTKNISIIEMYKLIPIIVILVIEIYIILNKKIKFTEHIQKNIIILTCFSIVMLGISLPIFNIYHIILSIILSLITFFYTIDILIIDQIFTTIKYENLIRNSIIICILILFIITILKFVTRNETLKYNHPYYGSNINIQQIQDIETVTNYIITNEKSGKNVKIISYVSNYYMNILNRNNGNLDLPFIGNLGEAGEDGLLEQVKNMENTIILINKEIFCQDSKKVREYLTNNTRETGEICNLLIYEK